MTYRQRVSETLKGMPGAELLADVHEGRDVPPLSGYYLNPISDEWEAVPPEMVDGLTLLPVFATDDLVTIYCVEAATGRVFAIDPESPWPPRQIFASGRDLVLDFVGIARGNQQEEFATQLEELLRRSEG
jgi:hypothetical protein